MKSRKIAIIRNAAPQDFGGGERFPIFLGETLKSQGYDPIIISRSKKLLVFAKENDQKTIKGWWWKRQQWSGKNNLLLPFYIAWQAILTVYYLILFMRLQPIAVHIQSKDDFIGATIAGHILGIRIIWTDHADLKHIWKNINIRWKNPIGKMIYKLAHYTHAITLVSQSEKALILQEIPNNNSFDKKLVVIYNGVIDISSTYAVKKDTVFTYLIASRLVIDKGISEAIDAFKTVHSSYNKTRLIIVGDGPQKRLFKKRAADYPAITFLGYKTDPLKYMSEADVFLQPTYHEGFSVALVEASMMSMPIIATNVGGNKEIIIDKKTGLLVPVKNSDALAEAMINLYKNKELKETIATNARIQYIKKFQFNEIVKKSFIPLYEGKYL